MKYDNIIKIQLESIIDLPVTITVNGHPNRVVVSGTTFYEVSIRNRTDYIITIEQETNDLDTTLSFKKLVLGKFDVTEILRYVNFDRTISCSTVSKLTETPIGKFIEAVGKNDKVILTVPSEFYKYVVDKIHLVKVFGE